MGMGWGRLGELSEAVQAHSLRGREHGREGGRKGGRDLSLECNSQKVYQVPLLGTLEPVTYQRSLPYSQKMSQLQYPCHPHWLGAAFWKCSLSMNVVMDFGAQLGLKVNCAPYGQRSWRLFSWLLQSALCVPQTFLSMQIQGGAPLWFLWFLRGNSEDGLVGQIISHPCCS